jgi:hypothetical protein
VKRAHPHPLGLASDLTRDAIAHFTGGFVGERDRQNARGVHAFFDEACDARRENARLSGASAGEDEKRSIAK